MTSSTVRERLVEAAFDLFEEQGYDATTADQIAARAGAGRTTFFRAFGSKDDVALVDHEQILAAVQDKLAEGGLGAARAAARIVLGAYMAGGDLARRRSRVVAEVPALRSREIIVMSHYQRLFYEHFRQDPAVGDPLTAELLAAAWVTTHNHVLRRWLAGKKGSPVAQLESGLDSAYARLVRGDEVVGDATVLVFRTGAPMETVLPAVEAALRQR